MQDTLPEELYAEVAPLPIPLATHLFLYIQSRAQSRDSLDDVMTQFLQEVAEKRRDTYLVMDSFVRNREYSQSPRHLRFSTQWIRTTLGQYSPDKKEIPSKTFNHWLSVGFIRSERKGQPTPDSSAALCALRMIIEGKKLLPHSMSRDEPPWWCYALASPSGVIRRVPITEIPRLPPQTLLWTPWPGASWDATWLLVGDYLGAIRFAGVQYRNGQMQYNVSIDDILLWRPDLAGLYRGGLFKSDEIQALARIALVGLAYGRIHSID